MQKLHRNLISLAKVALTDEPIITDDGLDYNELLKLSVEHHIVPLIFQGLYKTKKDFDSFKTFRSYTLQLIIRDHNQVEGLKKVEQIFTENGIDYMLLKGVSVKRFYSSSEFRLMGDVDILIKEAQYDKIKPLMYSIGFREKSESDHELIWMNGQRVIVELHKKLIPSYNDDYYSYYRNPWEKASNKDNCRFSMTPEDEYIYIFTHLTKHYRDGGIGLRHLIDIWLFNKNYPSLDMEYINNELDKLELTEFHKNILETLEVWFNGKDDTELSDYITERVISSGSFGLKEMHASASAARASAKTSSVSSAKRNSYIKVIFPSLATMKQHFSILTKYPFLLPFMWIVRWFNILVHKRGSITNKASQLSQINEETIDSYNEDLEKVGLKFNLKKK